MSKSRIGLLAVLVALGAALLPGAAVSTDGATRYLVVLAGQQGTDGFTLVGTEAAVQTLVATAGGTVALDLSKQIGVLVAESPSAAFDETLRASPLVAEASEDFKWALDDDPPPAPFADPSTVVQWDMQQIRVPEAHAEQDGRREVDVGILDSGIDGDHVEFKDNPLNPTTGSNVDCARGRDFVPLGPSPLSIGTPCDDNQFHGTHVAGIVAAQANGVGLVGVAPDVTLVPVKVCDTAGFCYASSATAGITYAGDAKLDVINMSFFVDDDVFLGSTEFKCSSDPVQRTFRHAVERAIQYARNQGVAPVAALGNSDTDLAHPPAGNECEVVPAETQGVIGTMALGRNKEKAGYSNYGTGATDVAAPGGNGTTGDCTGTVPSTFPNNLYICIQGTSMASPHAAGVAALIVSEFGTLGSDGDVKMSPTKVEQYLQATTVDQGLPGYDECFGKGRIDALRAVRHETSSEYDGTAPNCPEYAE